MAIRSQPPQQYARAPSRASDLELELKTLQERRAVLELERERLNVGAQEKQLLESQARSRKLTELFEDSPYPSEADGVDYNQVAAAKQLFESRALYEAYGAYDYLDMIGPGGYASTWGQPLGYGMQAYLNPLSTRVDRAQGRDRPFVITEVDLGFIRGVARIVCEINCPAKGAIRSLVNYTVGGRGFQYTVATKNQQRKPPDGLIEAVQEVVDEFLERVKWCGALGKEGELVRRWFRDGEYFLQAHCDRVGRTDLRFVEPEQITELGAQHWNRETMAEYGLEIGDADVDSTFGVLTPKHDVNVRWGYNAWYDDLGESELLPADTLQHFKISDTNIKRGISDFYGAVKWLQRSDNLLTKTAGGAAIQASIAGIRKHVAGVTQSDVSAFRASKTDYTTTAWMPGGNSRTTNNYAYPDGTILDIPFGLDWDEPPKGADRGPAFVEVAQAMLRWVSTQWSMPEWIISGDASNNNMASSLVAESPFVKNVQGLQFGFGAMWHDLIWRVIYNAARHGRFDLFGDHGSYYIIRKLLKLHLSFPTIETRDPGKETDRLKSLCDDGIISKKRRAAEEGYDLAEEEAQGATQQVAKINATADAPPKPNSGALTPDQITAAMNIVSQVSRGDIPRDAGLGQLKVFLGLSDDQSRAIMGSAGLTKRATESSAAIQPGAIADISGFNPHVAGVIDGKRLLTESMPNEALRQAIRRAAESTDQNPTAAQKDSGEYAKGRFQWNGLTITIENPKGSVRSGTSKDGRDWSQELSAHYGELTRSEGADGDPLDVFVGDIPESDWVFVIDQVNADSSFDECKIVIGETSEQAARQLYLSCYEDGWQGLGRITPMTIPQFKAWLEGDTSRPVGLMESAAPSRRTLWQKAQELLWGSGGEYP